MKKVAILGAGWLGEPLSYLLQKSGYLLWCSTTSSEKQDRLKNVGLDARLLKVSPDGIVGMKADFFSADILILSLPPGGRRDPAVEVNYPARIEHIITAAKAGGVKQVIFTSSTGIYGEQEGIVKEESPLLPITNSGKALISVEGLLRDAYGDQLTILRLAGLIGPDRNPGRWFAAKENVSAGNQRVNLVHREDVITTVAQVLSLDCWGQTINICGDEHPIKAQIYPQAAKVMGLKPPTFIPYDPEEKGKVVDNSKSKMLLNIDYTHTRQYFEEVKGFKL